MRHNEPVSHIMSDQMMTVHTAQKVSDVYRLLTENRIGVRSQIEIVRQTDKLIKYVLPVES